MKKCFAIILTLALVCSLLNVHAENSVFESPTDLITETSTDLQPPAEQYIPCEVTTEDNYVAGEILITIKAAHSDVNKIWTIADFPEIPEITTIRDLTYIDNEEAIERFRAKEVFHQTLEIEFNDRSKDAVINAIRSLEENPYVYFAEPNFIYDPPEPCSVNNTGIALVDSMSLNNVNRYQKSTNDPYLLQQNGIYMHNIDKVWNAFTKGSSNIVVGIIDTGIYNHEDLSDNLTLGYNCGRSVNETTYYDAHGHGTNVASIIGATGGSNKGISGVCQNITLYSLRSADSSGLEVAGALANAFVKAEIEDIPIVNISMSGPSYDGTLEVRMSEYSGLIVTTAGNGSDNEGIGREITDSNPWYQPCYDIQNMIVVGSIGENKTKSSFSNYSTTYVDLMAYGENVVMCENGGGYCFENTGPSGTSFSAPLVAGTAALLLSYNSNLTVAQLKQYILAGVQTTAALEDYCVTGGYLDAYGAFLAMLEDKPICMNLVLKAVPGAKSYSFSIQYSYAYARLSEIVISSQLRIDPSSIESLTITKVNGTILVDLVLDEPMYIESPIMYFHFISYSTFANAKNNVNLTTVRLGDEQNAVMSGSITPVKILTGDATEDNVVDISDMLRIVQYANGQTSLLSVNGIMAADVNGDNVVTQEDATQVGNYNVSEILSFY